MTRVKRYILKKDLPTFAAGDVFEIKEDGCLYSCDMGKDGLRDVMAYARRTLERFPNVLEDWFEEITDDEGHVGGDWRSFISICWVLALVWVAISAPMPMAVLAIATILVMIEAS